LSIFCCPDDVIMKSPVGHVEISLHMLLVWFVGVRFSGVPTRRASML
jgi:hypothetical protein